MSTTNPKAEPTPITIEEFYLRYLGNKLKLRYGRAIWEEVIYREGKNIYILSRSVKVVTKGFSEKVTYEIRKQYVQANTMVLVVPSGMSLVSAKSVDSLQEVVRNLPVERINFPVQLLTHVNPHNVFAMKVSGDGMSPEIKNGDLIICEFCSHFESGNIVILQKQNIVYVRYCRIQAGVNFYIDGRNGFFDKPGFEPIARVVYVHALKL